MLFGYNPFVASQVLAEYGVPDAAGGQGLSGLEWALGAARLGDRAALTVLQGGLADVPGEYRDVPGKGGWYYRQFADGSIEIRGAPHTGVVGLVLHADDSGKKGTAHAAITREIGPFPAEVAETQIAPSDTLRLPDDMGDLVWDALQAAGSALVSQKGLKAAGDALRDGAGDIMKGLLAAAGVAAAEPVVGWAVAGGLAAGAGTVALVRGIRRGRLTRERVVHLARQLGIPDAEEVPAFTVRAVKMNDAHRIEVGRKLAAAYKGASGHHQARIGAKLRILAAAHLIERAARRQGTLRGVSPGGDSPGHSPAPVGLLLSAHYRGQFYGWAETPIALGGFGAFAGFAGWMDTAKSLYDSAKSGAAAVLTSTPVQTAASVAGSLVGGTAGGVAASSAVKYAGQALRTEAPTMAASTAVAAAAQTGSAATLAKTAPVAAASDDAITIRIRRCLAGDITAGGAIDPREAVAFVVGYVEKRYLPAQKAKGLSSADEAKLRGILAPWRSALSAADADAAYDAALAIDAGKAAQIKAQLGALFSSVWTAQPTREKAIKVLEHAAVTFAGYGYPEVSAKCQLAADTTSNASASVFARVAAGVSQTVAATVDSAKAAVSAAVTEAKAAVASGEATLTAAGNAVKDTVSGAAQKVEATFQGGVAVATKTVGAVVNEAEAGLASAKQAAQDLAATGVSEIKAKLDAAEALVNKAKTAAGDAKDVLFEKVTALQTSLAADLQKVKDVAGTAQAALAAKVEEGLARAKAAAEAAGEVAGKVPALIKSAIAEGAANVRELAQAVKSAADDPCRLVPGAAGWLCRVNRSKWLPWVLLGGVAALLGLWMVWTRYTVRSAMKGLGATALLA